MTMISEETVRFLTALKDNNNREWFEANKRWYEESFKYAAARFSDEMAEYLKDQTGTSYKPKVFRIHRDVRFSKNKMPYNAHLHISFIPIGGGEDTPGWMIGLEPDRLVMGVGVFAFSKDKLDAWRAVVDGAEGEALGLLLGTLKATGARIDEPELKRVPAPYAADHPNGDLLRRKGLAVWTDAAAQSEMFGAEGPKNCWERLKPIKPVFDWLKEFSEV